MVFKLTEPDAHARAPGCPGRTCSTPPVAATRSSSRGRRPTCAGSTSGSRSRWTLSAASSTSARRAGLRPAGAECGQGPCSRSSLGEPGSSLLVAVDARVSPGLEHDVEVTAVDRRLGPLPVDDAPLLADDRDRLAVDPRRRPVEAHLDERRPRRIQSSCSAGRDLGEPMVLSMGGTHGSPMNPLLLRPARIPPRACGRVNRPPAVISCSTGHRRILCVSRLSGTNKALASGMRDHGATSTTAQTEPLPPCSRAPGGALP